MSVYTCVCEHCGHTFFDLWTRCEGPRDECVCPVCEKNVTQRTILHLPDNQQWGEAVGCCQEGGESHGSGGGCCT